jgi:N6-adenosine-specific RNA methylase IME4
VAVWVTNKLAYQNFVKKTLFNAWGVKYITTWYWIKVTSAGELVLPLDSPHRFPYEPILIGRRDPAESTASLPSLPDDTRFICSPVNSHSRKPPLEDIFSPYLRSNAYKLELFARNLLPGWYSPLRSRCNSRCSHSCRYSWGDEVLLFQNLLYWEPRNISGTE